MLNLAFANRLRSALPGSALALLVALAALAPAMATAAPKGSKGLPGFSVEMKLRGSHGYSVRIGADDHRIVSIIVSKGSTFASYSVPGRATSEGIEANFGKLGRISVRFTPARSSARRKRGCRVLRGHFRGVIRFRGELDYTQVTAKSSRGAVNPPGGGRRCNARAATRPGVDSSPNVRDLLARAAEPDFGITGVGAAAHMGGRTVVFYDVEALEITPDAKVVPFLTITIGGTEERRGRISISRLALLILGRRVAFPSPPGQQPLTATVKAPKPFQGTGSYLEVPDAEPTWTGDFSVSLPGAGLVPLTGPEFDALLCTGPLTKKTESCLDDLEKLVGEPPGLAQ